MCDVCPTAGLLCDLLWADPDRETVGWGENINRGLSFTFGSEIVSKFLVKHDLDLVCRAHQVREGEREGRGGTLCNLPTHRQ